MYFNEIVSGCSVPKKAVKMHDKKKANHEQVSNHSADINKF